MTLDQLTDKAIATPEFFDQQADSLSYWRDPDRAGIVVPREVVEQLIAGSADVNETAQPRRLARLLRHR